LAFASARVCHYVFSGVSLSPCFKALMCGRQRGRHRARRGSGRGAGMTRSECTDLRGVADNSAARVGAVGASWPGAYLLELGRRSVSAFKTAQIASASVPQEVSSLKVPSLQLVNGGLKTKIEILKVFTKGRCANCSAKLGSKRRCSFGIQNKHTSKPRQQRRIDGKAEAMVPRVLFGKPKTAAR
jgi:hypothetical protein